MNDGERPVPYWLQCLAGEVKSDAVPDLKRDAKKEPPAREGDGDGFSIIPIALLILAGLMLFD